MPRPRLSQHARDQMQERKITEEQVYRALNRPRGQPKIGSNGKIAVLGYAEGSRILKVVLTPDRVEIITVAWPDE